MPDDAPVTMANRSDIPLPPVAALAWLHDDLDARVLLLAERPVHVRRVVETDAVRDEERRIDVAALDAREQLRHVLVHVRLSHLERQALGERRAERELVEPAAVDAGDRDDAAFAAARDRLPQRVRAV